MSKWAAFFFILLFFAGCDETGEGPMADWWEPSDYWYSYDAGLKYDADLAAYQRVYAADSNASLAPDSFTVQLWFNTYATNTRCHLVFKGAYSSNYDFYLSYDYDAYYYLVLSVQFEGGSQVVLSQRMVSSDGRLHHQRG